MEFVESQTLEFKEQFNDSCKHTIVAFLSHGSGTIYIGINKNGKPVKLDDIDTIQRDISNFLIDQVSPRCIELVKTSLEDVDGYTVIKITVTQGDKLFYIKKYGLSVKGCYIRVGSTTREMTDEEIKRKYESTLDIDEPDITDIATHRKILTFQILKNYLSSHGYHYSDDTFDDNLHLRTKSGEYNLMAELLADTNDIVINVATFATTDKTEYLKRNEFGGKCLLLAMEQVRDYIEAIDQVYVDTKVRPRREKPMFDMNAFKEAWYNACVHYKWSEANNPGVYVYSDRLVVESYGGLPKNLTKEQCLKGVSRPVNKKLFDIFKACGFVEESGHGVPTVTKVYGEKAYEFDGSFIFVTIPFDRSGFTNVQETTKEIGETTKETTKETTQEKILNLLKNNPLLTRNDLMKILSMKEDAVQYHLNQLKKKGRIVHRGATKAGYWEVVD